MVPVQPENNRKSFKSWEAGKTDWGVATDSKLTVPFYDDEMPRGGGR